MSNRPGRKPTIGLTDPQRKTLAAIRDHIAARRVPPSMSDLGKTLGISAASAHEQVGQLVRKGYLRRDPGKARSLAIVREVEARPKGLVAIPLVGTVVAGSPLLSEENIEGEILVDATALRSGTHFALRISGDSMKDADIHQGDVIVVRQQPLAEHGDIVVALVNGDATVKRLSIRDERIELRPENKRLKPIPIEADSDLRVLGKVIAIRSMREGSGRRPRK